MCALIGFLAVDLQGADFEPVVDRTRFWKLCPVHTKRKVDEDLDTVLDHGARAQTERGRRMAFDYDPRFGIGTQGKQ